jgi:glycerate kinase
MPLTIAAAPNAFKGSLTPGQAAQAMAEGILRAVPDARVCQIPVSDGGDGLISAMSTAANGHIETVQVHDPRMRPVDGAFLFIADQAIAVVEMALASGLALLPKSLQDPCKTTTMGTGELVKAAMDKGATHIFMGIGGSATNDGGMGVAHALGYRFLDNHKNELFPAGESLSRIAAIDASGVDDRLATTRFSVACDVTNPLTGPTGAAHIFGPQKGADPDQVMMLDQGLFNLARVIKKDLGKEIDALDGAGAAGGLGGGMKAFFNAELTPGIDMVLDLIHFKERITGADVVLTGEGCIDGQTRFNKAPAGVALAARSMNIPCIAVCGSIGKGGNHLWDMGLDAVFSICPGPVSLNQAMAEAHEYLTRTSEQAVRAFIAGRIKNAR